MSDPKRTRLSGDALLLQEGSNRAMAAPLHTWFTSPARTHSNLAQAKELPLHLIQLILTHLDDVGDLARITRTSRLFYYMTLPRLYETVTLHSYAEIRYVDGRPEGYGNGSPFAMGLNTLVSRNFGDYIQTFRVKGDWREHDTEEYKQGRVPDNSMILQVVMRAAIDKMKTLKAFAWELSTPPLYTVYQGITARTSLVSLTLRCQTKRIPRPTTIIPPLPNLTTLIVYDIDPLCYPDDISLLLLGSKKLEHLTLHWSPRMRAVGEESVSLHSLFGRCMSAKYSIPLKHLGLYNIYTRFSDDGFHHVIRPDTNTELTLINAMGSSDPMTVFADDSWRIHSNHPTPHNLKVMRTDNTDKESAVMLGKFKGMERLYIVFALVPKLWAVRFLFRPSSDTSEAPYQIQDAEMHAFAIGTEFWRPEYKNVKYVGYGDSIVLKLGDVYYPSNKDSTPSSHDNSLNAKRAGPIRKVTVVKREDVNHIEIWGKDTTEFDPLNP
ncbi:uncharacterized protein J4E84_010301 [Alternaria hordeiaustralica]|uniref:uncharacterized protein n=1 Tax=Alternaria hordeiaustralica TaxID=1187925 RepID=UPI0020C3A605|nr:uncharacterized protein J4E84_010301 [Alternaria hordeiaustralica]KAI4674860.1 hypothetical protein J4E84_010301 [Alternaria hordeiaustralica]